MRYKICIRVKLGGGYGLGHFKRCGFLYKRLKTRYEVKWVVDFVKGGVSKVKMKRWELEDGVIWNGRGDGWFLDFLKVWGFNLVILDVRDTDVGLMKRVRKESEVLSLDDLGKGSEYASMTVQSLPRPRILEGLGANFEGEEYLILDPSLKDYKKMRDGRISEGKKGSIILNFGGEDPEDLTWKVLELLEGEMREWEREIKVILGLIYGGKKSEKNRKKRELIEDMIEDMAKGLENVEVMGDLEGSFYYRELVGGDILLSSFGIGVYEGLYLGLKVINIHGNRYHSELSDQVEGVRNLGVYGSWEKKELRKELGEELGEELRKELGRIEEAERKVSLKGLDMMEGMVKKLLECGKEEGCQICGGVMRVMMREGKVNHYYCEGCQIFCRGEGYEYVEEYEAEYFEGKYEEQYGKKYIEDKKNINILNRDRLCKMMELGVGLGRDLLEVGCGLGFFLELGRELGYRVEGCDISEYGTRYAREELGLEVSCKAFRDYGGEENGYDLIGCWYYIEHQKEYWEDLKKMYKLLKRGGVLGLSTPNIHGVSFLSDEKEYIKKIPKDHYIEFSPYSLKKVLEAIGFRVEKMGVRGVYEDRIKRWLRYGQGRSFLFERWMKELIRRLNLGDTFEIYARKK